MINGESKIAWYLSATAVIFLLFFVLGPFALPLLYKSPCFNNETKIILTILVLLFTAGVIFFSFKALSQLSNQMNQIDKILVY